MSIWMRLRSAVVGVAALTLGLTACGTNPATGQQSILGMSENQEVQLSKEEHPKILAEFGGEYDNPELQEYVSSLGTLLARTSERPELPWKFTVLNSPDINAFALPGGYIYITRGLLALASSEAEVASVLAHEIGHAAARHSSQRQGRATIAGLGAALAGILTGNAQIAQLGNVGAQLYVQKFSREQELEADTLGVRYMTRANYDPQAAVTFLRKLQQETRLAHPDAPEAGLMSSHPRTADRVQLAIKNAGEQRVVDPIVERDLYLSKIEGVTWGDDPDQGVIEGRRFIHPALRFEFEVPRGFRIINQPQQVLAQAQEGDGIIAFNQTKADGSLRRWFTDHPKAEFDDVERIDVNGLEGATGVTQGAVNNQKADMRIVLIRFDEDTVYQFVFATPQGRADKYERAFRETTYSFRKLRASEVDDFEPKRIDVVTVGSGDTVDSLARRMAVEDNAEEWFRVINGLDENDRVRNGQRVKVIVQ